MMQKPVWLNVASSVNVLESYVNLDNGFFFRLTALFPVFRLMPSHPYARNAQAHLEARRRGQVVLHDCRARLPYPDNSVDHILCSHFLEHVYHDQAQTIVRDFHRALRPGGTVHLIVPNLRHQVDVYLKDKSVLAAGTFVEETLLSSRARPSWRFRLMEAMGYEGLKHRWMYDEESLAHLALRAGFKPVTNDSSPSAGYRVQDGAASAHFIGMKATA